MTVAEMYLLLSAAPLPMLVPSDDISIFAFERSIDHLGLEIQVITVRRTACSLSCGQYGERGKRMRKVLDRSKVPPFEGVSELPKMAGSLLSSLPQLPSSIDMVIYVAKTIRRATGRTQASRQVLIQLSTQKRRNESRYPNRDARSSHTILTQYPSRRFPANICRRHDSVRVLKIFRNITFRPCLAAQSDGFPAAAWTGAREHSLSLVYWKNVVPWENGVMQQSAYYQSAYYQSA
ncbi:hypothetical protein IF1G_00230 [Cordyceps javanica]|uniref:Uncharacterized protein n=1 Tax=Cordyceps javanica TaxID=43265 RepID=A0A545VF02_9HYPO|nr:hypothetical protein IF1G_00230 [Cordyceps javanica]